MAKGKHQAGLLNEGGISAQKALLFQVTGNKRTERETEGRALHIAALSLEEIIRYMRTCHPDFDIAEVKVNGHIEVLSSSKYLD